MNELDRPDGMPAHGTRRRYRSLGCRCVACTRNGHGGYLPVDLRWPYKWLDRYFGERIKAWYTKEQIAEWKMNGIGDFEADEVCIRLGEFPNDVFPGYEAAGLDCGVYP